MKAPGRHIRSLLTLAAVAIAAGPACTPQHTTTDEIPIGLLLSYTGYLAANSSN